MPSPKDAPPASPPAAAAGVQKSRPSSRGSPKTPGPVKPIMPGMSAAWMADVVNRINLTAIATRRDDRLIRGSTSSASTSGPRSPRYTASQIADEMRRSGNYNVEAAVNTLDSGINTPPEGDPFVD